MTKVEAAREIYKHFTEIQKVLDQFDAKDLLHLSSAIIQHKKGSYIYFTLSETNHPSNRKLEYNNICIDDSLEAYYCEEFKEENVE